MSSYISKQLKNKIEKIKDLTPIGRVTIVSLKMNNPVIVAARLRWVIAGWHPPHD